MDSASRTPAPHRRVDTPAGVWFEDGRAAAARADRTPDAVDVRTRRLTDNAAMPCGEEEVLQLVEGLPPAPAGAPPGYAVGILDAAGEVYREVWLWGEGEALVFTARMNASGFGQVRAADPTGRYDTVFTYL
jgi:hypothetical protein